MDTWKAPDSDDFINMIQQWEEKEQVSFPPPKSGYNYYIYTCEGETYDRDAWQNRE